MDTKTLSRKFIALVLAAAVLSVYSTIVIATPGQITPTGELTVAGQVTVNGQVAISGATVFSDSTIVTGANSSALVSIGKLGRVELLPNTTLKLSFNEAGLTGALDAGKVVVTNIAGKSAIITTKEGATIADMNQANVFVVDVQCGNTRVETQSGLAMLRASGSEQQIAAGKNASAGQAIPGSKCVPTVVAPDFGSLTGGRLAALLLAAGGAVATAIIVGTTSDTKFDTGGGTVIVSPNR
jgi:hypothetical protein